MEREKPHYLARQWTWSESQWKALWKRLHAEMIHTTRERRIARQKSIPQHDPQKRE